MTNCTDEARVRAAARLRRHLAGIVAVLAVTCAALVVVGGGAGGVAAAEPVGLWSESVVPKVAAESDPARTTVGVRFTSSVGGSVTGIEFYRSAQNVGPHTGTLWSSDGRALATVAFPTTTATGWTTATFTAPVAISAGSTYVASYVAPSGHYADDQGVLSARTPVTNGPLTATAGVYTYGSGVPVSTWNESNYYVDVLFVAGTTTTSSTTTTRPSSTTTTRPSSTTTTTTRPSSTTTTIRSSTSTTTVSSGVCGSVLVWSNLDGCGWPGPGSTGFVDGQVFGRVVSGGLTITQDGMVVDGWQVSGGIQVRAQNVVIRNSYVTNSAGGRNGSGVIVVNPGFSATIDHNVLDGLNATHACVWHAGRSVTVTANECRGVNDGIFSWASQVGVDGTGDNFVIEGNWLQGFTTSAANGHVDGYQTEGARDGVIRHNTIDVTQDQTSAIAIWNSRKSSDNIVVDDNLLAGGGFTVYAEDYSPSEASPAGGYSVTNVSFTNNRFSTVHYSCVGSWGVWYPRGAPSDGWRRSGNVVLETGQKIDSANPTTNGRTCN